jgi:hypothetical protein
LISEKSASSLTIWTLSAFLYHFQELFSFQCLLLEQKIL